MKRVLVLALSLVLLLGSAEARRYHSSKSHQFNQHESDRDCRLRNHALEVEGRDLVITAVDHEDFEVEITRDFELFVDGDRVKLDADQKRMVEEYHGQVFLVIDEAKEIGWEGAKIGLQGAGIGMKAIKGVVKMIFTSYDEDDLERDMEREAEKIEIRAEALEDMADNIEEMAYDLEDMFDEMVEEIPELRKLDW
jgi:hypothetical protein